MPCSDGYPSAEQQARQNIEEKLKQLEDPIAYAKAPLLQEIKMHKAVIDSLKGGLCFMLRYFDLDDLSSEESPFVQQMIVNLKSWKEEHCAVDVKRLNEKLDKISKSLDDKSFLKFEVLIDNFLEENKRKLNNE